MWANWVGRVERRADILIMEAGRRRRRRRRRRR